MRPSHIIRHILHERTALGLVLAAGALSAAAGIPFEFVLFGVTLGGIALFHRHTLQVALAGLACIVLYKVLVTGFRAGPGLGGLALHLGHEWVILANLLGLLLGFAVLSRHFEESGVPAALPRFLPPNWKGGFLLLVMIFVLSSFLDNIAAALIGGTVATAVFRRRVHVGYLVAIVAASNAGGSGSVIGDTTTTMMWIDGVAPVEVLEAFLAAGVALFIFGLPAAWQQHRYAPLTRDDAVSVSIDWARIAIVTMILIAAIAANMAASLLLPNVVGRFPLLGVVVWVAILATSAWRPADWQVLPTALKGSIFLLALVLSASLMPVEKLPPASWATAFALGFVSAVFDNIPLTALALKQGGYDWGYLAYAVGFGGSMIWFGSSAGVAISNSFPQAKSVGLWLKHGWHVALAYVCGFFVMLAVLGWHPSAPHKDLLASTTSAAQVAAAGSEVQFGPMEVLLYGVLVVFLLGIMYRAGAKKDSFVHEYSRGSFLRELNAKMEAAQKRSGSRAARSLRVENIALALVAMAVIALVDAQSGQISLWPLYLGPVIFLSWLSGFAVGAIAAFFAGILLVIAVIFSGHPYSNHYFFAAATFSQVAALLVVAWLANRAAMAKQKRGSGPGDDDLNGLAH
jgi:Na+/H+ antiporter NhaD/arsenite permease-like protein